MPTYRAVLSADSGDPDGRGVATVDAIRVDGHPLTVTAPDLPLLRALLRDAVAAVTGQQEPSIDHVYDTPRSR